MDYIDLEKNKSADCHFWYKARRDLVKMILRKYSIENKEILEIGCGAGSQLQALSSYGNKVIGCDINNEALAEAKRRGFNVFFQDVSKNLKDDTRYDVVCAFDLLEHVDEDNEVLKNINKLLKPGGIFIFTVPAFKALFSNHDVYLRHKRRYSLKDISGKISKNNFELVDIFYWNFILFPIIALKRLLSKNSKPKSDAYELNRVINKILFYILILENALIKARFKSPFGLSIVGVAKSSTTNR